MNKCYKSWSLAVITVWRSCLEKLRGVLVHFSSITGWIWHMPFESFATWGFSLLHSVFVRLSRGEGVTRCSFKYVSWTVYEKDLIRGPYINIKKSCNMWNLNRKGKTSPWKLFELLQSFKWIPRNKLIVLNLIMTLFKLIMYKETWSGRPDYSPENWVVSCPHCLHMKISPPVFS